MKKFLTMLMVSAAAFSLAQAAACPEANYDACASDGYAIVETEPDTYWPHNEMAAAHWVGYHYKRKKTYHHIHHSCR